MISRYLEPYIEKDIAGGKAIIIFGARQVGKTTLLKQMFGDSDAVWLNADEESVRNLFDQFSAAKFEMMLGDKKVFILDEAQRIADIGLKLKIAQDNFGDKVQIIATGSSSFELANKINEPMTGRKWEYHMYPLSFSEMVSHHGLVKEMESLENRLLFGYYPDIVSSPSDAQRRLQQLVDDNLYKDILQLDGINKPSKLSDLLKALAFQIGAQVSVNELSNIVGLDNKTVEKYLSLLEQSYVIFHISSYSSNLRNEIKSSNKYFFYDVGVRNAIIGDFRPISIRQDIGGLFENFIIAELQKTVTKKEQFFWRTHQQQEVDYLWFNNGEMSAAEIKWNEKRNPRLPKTFTEKYNPSDVHYLNRQNFYELLLAEQSK
ncbi:MAG: ATP-binding protein [Candidatus Saccharibacteria bacterium]|nr:ATP-binding protein [Candidatus Saccharibacteria bacterium]